MQPPDINSLDLIDKLQKRLLEAITTIMMLEIRIEKMEQEAESRNYLPEA